MGNLQAVRFNTALSPGRVRKYALAMAGAAVQETAQADSSVEEVSVTGARVQRDGYSAPTPVTVVGAEQIDAQAPQNLADFVNKLPSFIGSETPNTSAGSLSNGLAGINALNLRSPGVNRTLIVTNGKPYYLIQSGIGASQVAPGGLVIGSTTNPPLVASGPDGNNTPAYPQTNRSLYDYLGRVYRIGLRVKM